MAHRASLRSSRPSYTGHIALLIPCLVAALLLAPRDARAQASCQSLSTLVFPNTAINTVTSYPGGPYVSSDTWHIVYTNLPPYCEVVATITPVADSTIKIKVWLPTQRYNGRFLGTGNGGYAGAYFDSELAQGINNGFATGTTDLGLGVCGSVNLNADGCTGHPEAWKDFGYRATHLMTDFSKALIQAFYGQSANKSYFAGCSTGGQQALMEAQRYPNDYDGILGGAPAYDRTHIHTTLIGPYRATHQPATGLIPPAKLDVVNQAVVAQCVRRGRGAPTDAFISDPQVCNFNPASLQCPGNVDGTNCLTTDQVNTLNVSYQGSVNPVTGALIYPGVSRGSETSNALALGLAVNEAGAEPAFDSLFKWVFGLTWQWQTFDFNQDMATVDQTLAADLNATSTDLSAFKNRGGKLILYHGWADPLVPPAGTIKYYKGVATTMFGDASSKAVTQTQSFARLYMAPGMWHCGGSVGPGPGPSSFGGMIQQPAPSFDPQHDLLSALTAWVENGTPPGPVIATKYNNDQPTAGIQMQRPLCVYPESAIYNGAGDPNLPASFACGVNTLAAHDFNGDGRSDIALRQSAGYPAIWLMNGGSIAGSKGFQQMSQGYTIVGQRDFDGDGNADWLWRGADGSVTMWFLNGTSATSGVTLGVVPTAWTVAGTADFNADGKGDIIWRDTAGNIAIWLMNGPTTLSSVVLGQLTLAWTIVGTGDFDGDGKADILFRDTSGNLAIWFMNGTTFLRGVSLGQLAGWSIVGTGDFNGDGNADILFRDTGGNIAVWLMNGSSVIASSVLGSLPTSFSVIETGDFNSDAKTDIVWRDAKSGATAVWYMNGATVAATTNVPNAGLDWALLGQNAD